MITATETQQEKALVPASPALLRAAAHALRESAAHEHLTGLHGAADAHWFCGLADALEILLEPPQMQATSSAPSAPVAVAELSVLQRFASDFVIGDRVRVYGRPLYDTGTFSEYSEQGASGIVVARNDLEGMSGVVKVYVFRENKLFNFTPDVLSGEAAHHAPVI